MTTHASILADSSISASSAMTACGEIHASTSGNGFNSNAILENTARGLSVTSAGVSQPASIFSFMMTAEACVVCRCLRYLAFETKTMLPASAAVISATFSIMTSPLPDKLVPVISASSKSEYGIDRNILFLERLFHPIKNLAGYIHILIGVGNTFAGKNQVILF